MKRRLAGLILLILSVVLVFGEAVQADFVTSEGNTLYVNESGQYVTGLQTINGKLYLFDSSGILQKGGWVKSEDGRVFYADEDGSLLQNKWKKIKKKKYYLKEDGERAAGLTDINGKLYYFSQKNGRLQKGKLKTTDGKLYIANKKTGVVYAGRFFKFDNKKYYANSNGTLALGLTKVGNYYYFFHRKNGKMLTKVKKKVDGYYYYFKKNGRAAMNTWVKIKKKYYYFNEEGRMVTNKYIGKWYVGSDGVRVKASKGPQSSIVEKDGKYYCYDYDNNLVVNQWFTCDGETYYAGADGAALTGVQTIENVKYYFAEDGKLAKNTVAVIGNSSYIVDSEGKVQGKTKTDGSAIVKYAKQFVGNPYVYGGTSLTNGADCSGFCFSVFKSFGIQLMRVADDQMDGPSAAYQKLGYKKGYAVKDSELSPGDLVFYGSASYATHVAIYAGDNKVVHACNTKLGIIISDIDYCHNRVHNKSMRYWA